MAWAGVVQNVLLRTWARGLSLRADFFVAMTAVNGTCDHAHYLSEFSSIGAGRTRPKKTPQPQHPLTDVLLWSMPSQDLKAASAAG